MSLVAGAVWASSRDHPVFKGMETLLLFPLLLLSESLAITLFSRGWKHNGKAYVSQIQSRDHPVFKGMETPEDDGPCTVSGLAINLFSRGWKLLIFRKWDMVYVSRSPCFQGDGNTETFFIGFS